MIRAFLSHSSENKDVVNAVYDSLKLNSLWLDSAEIEWGDLFLDELESGIQHSSDFVLFWSLSASRSYWVKTELHMAFVKTAKERNLRIRVVSLDKTDLPLFLQPFHVLDVSESEKQAESITAALSEILSEPPVSALNRFLNRSNELKRIEDVLIDPQLRAVLIWGFRGLGKSTLVHEAVRRLYLNGRVKSLPITAGTDFSEITLKLRSASGREIPSHLEAENLAGDVAVSIESLAKQGVSIAVFDIQSLLDDGASPRDSLNSLLDAISAIPALNEYPIFFTSSRRPYFSPKHDRHVGVIRIDGMEGDYAKELVQRWYRLETGTSLPDGDASTLSAAVGGHPLGAKLAASQAAIHGVESLDLGQAQGQNLRGELTSFILAGTKLSKVADDILGALAFVATTTPSGALIDALDCGEAAFYEGVEECARLGLLTNSTDGLSIHPTVQAFFWRNHRTRPDFEKFASSLATGLTKATDNLDPQGERYVRLIPAVIRLFALAGDTQSATQFRRDLGGQWLDAAKIHYQRRDLSTAERFIDLVLEYDPDNFEARLYLVRIEVRRGNWTKADEILESLKAERPNDRQLVFTIGWRYYRSEHHKKAIDTFLPLVENYDHGFALNLIARCLDQLGSSEEALLYAERAISARGDDPAGYVTKAMVLQRLDRLEEAAKTLERAQRLDPHSSDIYHRLGMLALAKQERGKATALFDQALQETPERFEIRHILISTLIDTEVYDRAVEELKILDRYTTSRRQRDLSSHLKARLALHKRDFDKAEEILKVGLNGGTNRLQDLNLAILIKISRFDADSTLFPNLAKEHLIGACRYLKELGALRDSGQFVTAAKEQLRIRGSNCDDS